MTAPTILPCDQSVAGEFGQHLCAPCEHECIDALVQAFAAHREAGELAGVRIGMAFAVKNIVSDGIALAALYGTDPAEVIARHGGE